MSVKHSFSKDCILDHISQVICVHLCNSLATTTSLNRWMLKGFLKMKKRLLSLSKTSIGFHDFALIKARLQRKNSTKKILQIRYNRPIKHRLRINYITIYLSYLLLFPVLHLNRRKKWFVEFSEILITEAFFYTIKSGLMCDS